MLVSSVLESASVIDVCSASLRRQRRLQLVGRAAGDRLQLAQLFEVPVEAREVGRAERFHVFGRSASQVLGDRAQRVEQLAVFGRFAVAEQRGDVRC